VNQDVSQKLERPGWRLPLFQGLLPFDRSRLGRDILAGVTLAAMGIPTVMGYTKIIGTPVITGLYTLLLPVVVFAIFGSSRHLVVSADSATAAMVAASLTSLSLTPDTPKFVAFTSLVGLVAAGMLLTSRVLRLGFLADFLSRTVLVGFLSGVGVQVALGQLNGLLGLPAGGHGFLRELFHTIQHLSEAQLSYVLISLTVLGIILGCQKFLPRFPGALFAVIGMIFTSSTFHWAERGVAVVGEVPHGLPQFGLPAVELKNVLQVLPVAFSCFIVILAQSAATSRAYAVRYRDAFNQNVDLVGLALANVAAGCSGTFVVNGSPTQTAMVESAGGRSQVSHLATASMVVIVLLFLTKPLAYLPNAVLAAVVFLIGVKLIDFHGLRQIYQMKPREFGLAIATAGTVVIVGVEQGILLAVGLSLLQHVRRSYQPHTAVVLFDPVEHWKMEPALPGKMIEPGVVMYWFGAELFYANSAHFAEQARSLVIDSTTPVRWLVIDASAIISMDFTAGRVVADLQRDLANRGVVLAFTRVSPNLRRSLDRLELTELIGAKHIFVSRRECLAAYATTATHAGPLPSSSSGDQPLKVAS
jgi:sulfate permease, SulP family